MPANDTDHEIGPWGRFWFIDPVSPAETARLLRVLKLGMAIAAFWYFASHWSDIGYWFAGDGVLGRQGLASFLRDADLGRSVNWRLSPLYWVDHPFWLRGYLALGMLLSVASVVVTRSRIVSILLWLVVVGLANRSLLISGLEDLVLCWGLGYLAIAPADAVPHWTASFSRRLIQLHVSWVIAVTGLTMLSSLVWWDGTGVIAVVAPVEDRLTDWVETLRSPWVHEPLTHAIVAVGLLAPILLWNARTRRTAWGAATLWCVVLGLLSSQLLYFFSVAVLLQSFCPLATTTLPSSAFAANPK